MASEVLPATSCFAGLVADLIHARIVSGIGPMTARCTSIDSAELTKPTFAEGMDPSESSPLSALLAPADFSTLDAAAMALHDAAAAHADPLLAPDPRRPLLVSFDDAVVSLDLCRRSLWTLCNSGKLAQVRIGRSVRVDRRSLIEHAGDKPAARELTRAIEAVAGDRLTWPQAAHWLGVSKQTLWRLSNASPDEAGLKGRPAVVPVHKARRGTVSYFRGELLAWVNTLHTKPGAGATARLLKAWAEYAKRKKSFEFCGATTDALFVGGSA